MNWHFLFFLFDVIGWIAVAVLFNYASTTKFNKVNFSFTAILSIISIALFAGCFSVLIHGLPEIGLSTKSFIYVFLASFGVVFYQQTRVKPKLKTTRVLTKILAN